MSRRILSLWRHVMKNARKRSAHGKNGNMANAKIKTDQIPSMDPKETQRVGKKVTSQTATNISTNLISKPSKAPTLVANTEKQCPIMGAKNSSHCWRGVSPEK